MADESTLGWLHLTDLHIGQPREGGRLTNIERAFLEDIARVVRLEKLPIAVVFVSGDIAFRGTDAEYVRTSAVLGRICDQINTLNREIAPDSTPPLLVPVPGNHDLVRPRPTDAATIRAALASRTAGSPGLWAPGQEGVRDLVETSFSGYRAWLGTHPLPFPPGAKTGVVPGDLCASISRSGVSLGVLGLNSAFLHLGDEAPGTLHLDLSQVTRLLGTNPGGWIESHHFNVLVTHHPPSWLSPVARRILDQEIKPDSLFDLHLYGHEHVGRFGVDPGTSGVRHLIEGRSLFGAEEEGTTRLHGYTVGRFVLTAPHDGKREKRVEVWTRQGWRDDHGWRFGPSDERRGRWRLVIELGDTAIPSTPDTRAADLIPGLGRLDAAQKTLGRWKSISKPDDLNVALEAEPARRWIFLSASVPTTPDDPGRRATERDHLESAHPEAIRAFVIELARQASVPGSNLGIIFGGHPTITQALAPLVLKKTGGGRWLALVQDEHYWFNLVEEVGVVSYGEGVLPFLVTTAGRGPDLVKLRTAMLSPRGLAAAVFVGGLTGVIDEFRLSETLRPDVPRFAVGLGGGAAASLLLDPKTAPSAMGATPPDGDPRVTVAARLWHTPKLAVDAIIEALS